MPDQLAQDDWHWYETLFADVEDQPLGIGKELASVSQILRSLLTSIDSAIHDQHPLVEHTELFLSVVTIVHRGEMLLEGRDWHRHARFMIPSGERTRFV